MGGMEKWHERHLPYAGRAPLTTHNSRLSSFVVGRSMRICASLSSTSAGIASLSAFAVFERFPPLIERGEVPLLALSAHNPQPPFDLIEREPPADREFFDHLVTAELLVAEEAGGVHGGERYFGGRACRGEGERRCRSGKCGVGGIRLEKEHDSLLTTHDSRRSRLASRNVYATL